MANHGSLCVPSSCNLVGWAKRSEGSRAHVSTTRSAPSTLRGVEWAWQRAPRVRINQTNAMAAEPIIRERERAFVDSRRVAHLATADRHGHPHVVPICFVLAENTLYSTIDEKPKGTKTRLKRLSNIAENSATAVVIDRYDEDWGLLGWVMLRGRAEILRDGAEHDRAQMLLRSRYQQLDAMHIAPLAVIALRIERVTSWGNLGSDS